MSAMKKQQSMKIKVRMMRVRAKEARMCHAMHGFGSPRFGSDFFFVPVCLCAVLRLKPRKSAAVPVFVKTLVLCQVSFEGKNF